jgi:GT2 family glycosyltransferase
MVKFSVIIVSYNNLELLKNCLASLDSARKGEEVEIIVIDNNSENSVVSYLEAKQDIVLIKNSQNEGFGRANNHGAKIANGKWIILLNNDTVVPIDFFSKIESFFLRYPQCALMGPLVLSADGMPQPTFYNSDYYRQHIFPTRLFRKFVSVLSFGTSVEEKKSILQRAARDYSFVITHDVEVLSGVCLCMDRKVYEDIGLFDEHYFMYVEDMDFCLSARKHGYRLAFFPELSIKHFIKPIKQKSSISWTVYHNNVRYFFRKNFPFSVNLIAQPVLAIKAAVKQFIILYNKVSY